MRVGQPSPASGVDDGGREDRDQDPERPLPRDKVLAADLAGDGVEQGPEPVDHACRDCGDPGQRHAVGHGHPEHIAELPEVPEHRAGQVQRLRDAVGRGVVEVEFEDHAVVAELRELDPGADSHERRVVAAPGQEEVAQPDGRAPVTAAEVVGTLPDVTQVEPGKRLDDRKVAERPSAGAELLGADPQRLHEVACVGMAPLPDAERVDEADPSGVHMQPLPVPGCVDGVHGGQMPAELAGVDVVEVGRLDVGAHPVELGRGVAPVAGQQPLPDPCAGADGAVVGEFVRCLPQQRIGGRSRRAFSDGVDERPDLPDGVVGDLEDDLQPPGEQRRLDAELAPHEPQQPPRQFGHLVVGPASPLGPQPGCLPAGHLDGGNQQLVVPRHRPRLVDQVAQVQGQDDRALRGA